MEQNREVLASTTSTTVIIPACSPSGWSGTMCHLPYQPFLCLVCYLPPTARGPTVGQKPPTPWFPLALTQACHPAAQLSQIPPSSAASSFLHPPQEPSSSCRVLTATLPCRSISPLVPSSTFEEAKKSFSLTLPVV